MFHAFHSYLSLGAVLKVRRCLIEPLHQWSLLYALGPLEPHRLIAVGYDDVFGPVLQGLEAIE